MNWRDWLRPRRGSAPPEVAAAIEGWRAMRPPDANQALSSVRWVVVDTESAGLDPHRDALLSIGSCIVRDAGIRLSESFARLLRQGTPSAPDNILIHGIAGQDQLRGDYPAQALADFLAFAGSGVFVAFHAPFDAELLRRAMRLHLSIAFTPEWIDIARLAPALFPHLCERNDTLESWLGRFDIPNFARHDAVADAFATAELLLMLLPKLHVRGVRTLRSLQRLLRAGNELSLLQR